MLSCKELVKIVSSSTEGLSWSKRVELRLHLMMCKGCSRYVTHLEALSESFSRVIRQKTEADPRKVIQIEEDVIKKIGK